MANKKEKQLMSEIQLMTTKIAPGVGGTQTVTTIEIGQSWVAHEPLYNQLSIAIYNYNNFIHTPVEAEDLNKDYFLKVTEAAIEEFWELNKEFFKEDRPNF